MTDEFVADAERIAEKVLFAAAMGVDNGTIDPAVQLDLLAEQGFYGLAAPPDVSGLALSSMFEACRVVEVFAGGCLTTTFVWVQHHTAVMAAGSSERPGIRDQWLVPLATGQRRAGLAIGAVVRPGPPTLTATPVEGGFLFDGKADWITGWGLVDTLYAAARDAEDNAVWALLDAVEGPTLRAEPLEMVAVQSSRTVRVVFDGHFVPEDRVTSVVPQEKWSQPNVGSLRFNGSLALGLAGRCAKLADDDGLRSEVDACRASLDASGPDEIADARAAACELALRAAATLTVATGSRAVLMDDHAQRLMREATFLLVFGLRPDTKDALQARFSPPGR